MTTIKRALMTFSEIVIISAVNLWPGSVTNREFEHNVSCAPLCDTMLYACSTGSICNTIFNLTNVPFAPYKFLLLWFSFFTWRLDETHELQYFLVKTRLFPRSKCSNSWYCYYQGNSLTRSSKDECSTRPNSHLREGFKKKVAVFFYFVQIASPPSPPPNLDNLYHFFNAKNVTT